MTDVEQVDPQVQELLERLNQAESELNSVLRSLEKADGDYNPRDCKCDLCNAIVPLYEATKNKLSPCSCRLCRMLLVGNGHTKSCSCKTHLAIRTTKQAIQLVRDMLE